MYIIYIKNYKKSFALLAISVITLLTVLFITNLIVTSHMRLNITINNTLSFSYPFSYELDNIFINKKVSENSIQTNTIYKRPVAQHLVNFQSQEGHFSFNYPSIFTIQEQVFSGSDILYHIDFQNKAQKIHGFVQVWDLPYSLEEFLSKSKNISQQNIQGFSQTPVKVNGLPGYLWDYTVTVNTGETFKVMEVFFKKNDRMYRISYFVPIKSWSEEQSKTFWNIVNSFKVY